MLTIPIQFDDLLKVVEQLTPEQKRILRENLEKDTVHSGASQSREPRVPDLFPGIWTSDNFDDPLPTPPDAQASVYRERQ